MFYIHIVMVHLQPETKINDINEFLLEIYKRRVKQGFQFFLLLLGAIKTLSIPLTVPEKSRNFVISQYLNKLIFFRYKLLYIFMNYRFDRL